MLLTQETENPIDASLRNILFRFIDSRVKNAAVAEDITQEVLLRIHTKIESLADSSKLTGWAFQIARNSIADHFRSYISTEEFSDDGASTSNAANATHQNEEEMIQSELNSYIRSVVEGLPEKYRDALLFTEYEGHSQVEFAKKSGISVSAAKSRVQRARTMVKAVIEQCCRWETDRYGTVIDVQPRKPTSCQCEEC